MYRSPKVRTKKKYFFSIGSFILTGFPGCQKNDKVRPIPINRQSPARNKMFPRPKRTRSKNKNIPTTKKHDPNPTNPRPIFCRSDSSNILKFSKIELLVKTRNFGRHWKYLSKIEIFLKARNFDESSKYLLKIEILVETRNFCQKSKFWPTIEISVKNRNFPQKSKYLLKIEILVETRNVCQQSKFFVKNLNFG